MRAVPGAARLLCVVLVGIALGGCDRGTTTHGGNAALREESRGGLHYRLRSEVTPRRATIGDPVRWTLIAELPPSVAPGTLQLDPSDPALEVTSRDGPSGQPSNKGGRWTWKREVRGFGLGSLALPAARLPVVGKGVLDTLGFPPDSLTVDSLTHARADSLAPDRGPLPTELRPIDYAVAAGLILISLAILWLTIAALRSARTRKRGLTAVAEAPLPPEESYRLALAALRESGDSLPFDVFYERLSGAIRDYAAAVTGVPARDRTTTEIERELASGGSVAPEGVKALGSALRHADLAKFARRAARWEEARAALAEAERLPERLPAPGAPPSSPTAIAGTPAGGAAPRPPKGA